MIAQFMGLSPVLESVQTARNLLGILSLSPFPPQNKYMNLKILKKKNNLNLLIALMLIISLMLIIKKLLTR